MPRFSFVLKETPSGRATHDQHIGRRTQAKVVARSAGCGIHGEPQEMLVTSAGGGDDYYYWWVLDAPDLQTLQDVLKIFTVDNHSVQIAVAPVQHD